MKIRFIKGLKNQLEKGWLQRFNMKNHNIYARQLLVFPSSYNCHIFCIFTLLPVLYPLGSEISFYHL